MSSGGGEGVGDGHHFLLYVSAIDDKKCSSTSKLATPPLPSNYKFIFMLFHYILLYIGGILADSAHCLQEDDFDRPTAAYLNFCPRALSTDHTLSTLQLQLVLKELIHTMVRDETKILPFILAWGGGR